MLNSIFKIESIKHLNSKYFVITIDLGEEAYNVKAGQFFELKRPELTYPMLKKPISVYDIQGTIISLMIKRLGKATEQFAQMQAGDSLEVLGALGNGFPLVENQRAVLVSGGIGYPPLYYLKQKLKAQNTETYWLHGGQGKDDVFPADEIWTNDGSVGKAGLVTDGFIHYMQTHQADIVYACGPKPMLKALSFLAAEFEVPLYVSLEEYMACGIGACHGCAVKVKTDDSIGTTYQTVCKDGPVFNSRDIVWE